MCLCDVTESLYRRRKYLELCSNIAGWVALVVMSVVCVFLVRANW